MNEERSEKIMAAVNNFFVALSQMDKALVLEYIDALNLSDKEIQKPVDFAHPLAIIFSALADKYGIEKCIEVAAKIEDLRLELSLSQKDMYYAIIAVTPKN